MIQNIYVKNFILIDELSLDFSEQYSCFSGETGAGKSLLIDAIALLCGAKSSTSYIQKGAEKAIIEATIQITNSHPSYQILQDAGFELEEGCFVISKEITIHNRSVNRLNHRQVNVALMKAVMSQIVDIHSQHDNQYLLNKKQHIYLLDNYIQQPQLIEEVKQSYAQYDEQNKKLQKLLNKEVQEEDLDYLQFQLNEIEQVNLQEHEFEQLLKLEKQMTTYEKEVDIIEKSIQQIKQVQNHLLYDSAKQLEKIEQEKIQACKEQLLSAYYLIDEQIDTLHDYQNSLEFDHEQFDKVQSRLFAIHKLLRKHGPGYNELMKHKSTIADKIHSIVYEQDHIDQLNEQVQNMYATFETKALSLRKKRIQCAKQLEHDIRLQLQDLSLQHAQFSVSFSPTVSKYGLDDIEFMISMNKGEALKPLASVASGGELSRLMLGLKSIFSRLSNVTTLIFDEIDNGVSGQVAYVIGKKMNTIGKEKQVFAVTHLAPVACWANYHYLVEKTSDDKQTFSQIKCLNEQETIQELAMISFAQLSDQAILASKELYDSSKDEK